MADCVAWAEAADRPWAAVVEAPENVHEAFLAQPSDALDASCTSLHCAFGSQHVFVHCQPDRESKSQIKTIL
jgi:hypothetical protein